MYNPTRFTPVDGEYESDEPPVRAAARCRVWSSLVSRLSTWISVRLFNVTPIPTQNTYIKISFQTPVGKHTNKTREIPSVQRPRRDKRECYGFHISDGTPDTDRTYTGGRGRGACTITYYSATAPRLIALICGAKNCGKTTFSRYLLNILLQRFKSIALKPAL